MISEIKTVYRIEHPEDMDGLWYTKEGILRKRINILCPDGISKDFPMPFNLLHKKDNEVWNSAGKSIEQMNYWFTPEDAKSLYSNGFKLFRFDVSMFQELEHEILFCRKGIIRQKELALQEVWQLAEPAAILL